MGLKAVRKARGLTQTELAALSGVEQSHISALENAPDPNVGWHIVRRLARALKAKPHELFPRDARDAGVRA